MNRQEQLIDPAAASRRRFEDALTEYQRLRKISDDCPLGEPHEDQMVDDYCVAMDHLIDEVPAPDLNAVIVKWELAQARAEGFCGLIGDHEASIMADLRRLAAAN